MQQGIRRAKNAELEGSMIRTMDISQPAQTREQTCECASSNWYAVYVKSRHEFYSANELEKKGVALFLPSVKRISRWKDRIKAIRVPLFPGYVFVKLNPGPGVFLNVLKTPGIVAFVSLEPGTPAPVAADEINSLQLMLDSGRAVDLYPGLKDGCKVRIKSGPLVNAEGVLNRKINELVFTVNVALLGRSVAVNIAPEELEAV
jgi:transcription antitermination factor NusG